jgi:hypothetical protein
MASIRTLDHSEETFTFGLRHIAAVKRILARHRGKVEWYWSGGLASKKLVIRLDSDRAWELRDDVTEYVEDARACRGITSHLTTYHVSLSSRLGGTHA